LRTAPEKRRCTGFCSNGLACDGWSWTGYFVFIQPVTRVVVVVPGEAGFSWSWFVVVGRWSSQVCNWGSNYRLIHAIGMDIGVMYESSNYSRLYFSF